MTDSNPSNWWEVKAAYIEAGTRDITAAIIHLEKLEGFFESYGDQLGLVATREQIGLLRERRTTLMDEARELRAHRDEPEQMPISMTTRRRP